MLRRNSLMLLISLLILNLSSCAIKPPDIWVCAELYPDEGICRKSLSDVKIRVTETNKLDNKTWWEMKPSFLMLPPESWTEIKTFVNKVCKKYSKECEGEVPGWDRQVKNIDELQMYGN